MRWLILILILLGGTPAFSQTPDPKKLESLTKAEEDARRDEAELSKKRKTIQSEIDKLKKQLVETASEASSYEKEGLTLEQKLTELTTEETALQEKIYSDRQTVMQLLAALQRIENNPPPPLSIQPKDAAEAARAEKLMVSLSAELQARADELSKRLRNAQALRDDITSKHQRLSVNERTLSKRRNKISDLVKKKTELEKTVSKDQADANLKIEKLASEAKSLKDLIDSFEAEGGDVVPRIKPKVGSSTKRTSIASKPIKLPKGTAKFVKAKGKLRAPIAGKVIQKYGNGEKGITVRGRSKSQVVAPYAGRIEFAGAFKNYDNVVIINVGEGYFILLTGLGETYVETGENITTGEPLGLLPFKSKGSANLYIEFRKNGTTVNPHPWLGPALARNG